MQSLLAAVAVWCFFADRLVQKKNKLTTKSVISYVIHFKLFSALL